VERKDQRIRIEVKGPMDESGKERPEEENGDGRANKRDLKGRTNCVENEFTRWD
jgi:hypothetical protein